MNCLIMTLQNSDLIKTQENIKLIDVLHIVREVLIIILKMAKD